jgi:hypothetical protein
MHLLPATYNIPADIYQLVDFIGAFSILVDVLLGLEKQVAISLRSHHWFWDLQKSMVANSLPRDAHGLVILGTLCYLQLNICDTLINKCIPTRQSPHQPSQLWKHW